VFGSFKLASGIIVKTKLEDSRFNIVFVGANNYLSDFLSNFFVKKNLKLSVQ
jgi:hypothetical protein